MTTPVVSLMIAQITNLLEVPHIDFQSVLVDHDPLYPTNTKRQRGWRGTRKGGHFHARLRRTVAVPFPIIFGDRTEADRCAERLRAYHAPMTGLRDDGTGYSAASPEAMLFAAVTITHAALIAYERLAVSRHGLPRRLPDHERSRYLAEMVQLAVLMGVPRADVPTTSAELAAYYASISEKFQFRKNWYATQIRTATTLLRPAGIGDVGATLADIALMASAILALAVLPKPSRRLNGVPALLDPALALLRLAALPALFALSFDPVRRAVQHWYLGSDATAVVDRAATTHR